MISPEHKNIDDLELWYRRIGDENALYLIRNFKEQERAIVEALDGLPDTELLEDGIWAMEQWLDDMIMRGKLDEKQIDFLQKFSKDMNNKIKTMGENLDSVATCLSEV